MVRKNIGNWKKLFQPIITPDSWSNHVEREQFIRQLLARRRFPKSELLEVLANAYTIGNRTKRLEIIDTIGFLFKKAGDADLPLELIELYKSSEDRDLRRFVIRLLPQISNAGVIPEIVKLYRHPNKTFRDAARDVLEKFDVDTVVDCLSTELTRGVWANRTEPLRFLNDVAPDKILEPCRQSLTTGNEDDRITAIELLAELRTPDAMRLLADSSSDNSTRVRLTIASAVGRIPGDTSVDILLELTEDPKSAVIVKALEGLRRLADVRGIDACVACANHEDSHVRAQSLFTLGEIGSAEHVELLLRGIKDPDIHIRQSALQATIHISRKEGIDITRLITLLMADEDVNVRRAGAQILGEVQAAELYGKIFEYLQDPDWWVREMVANSLAKIKDRRVFPAVVDLLHHPDPSLRRYAIEILISIGNTNAVREILKLLKDPDWWVRERAVVALGKLGDEKIIGILSNLLDIPDLSRAAANALGDIGHVQATGPLLEHLDSADTASCLAILDALDQIKARNAISTLERYLNHPNRDIRNKTKEVLAHLRVERMTALKPAVRSSGKRDLSILDTMLMEVRREGGSDLFLVTGQPAIARFDGKLMPISEEILSQDQILSMASTILTPELDQHFQETRDLDFSYEIDGGGRFRGNMVRHSHGLNLVLRVLPDQIPSLEDLGLPGIVAEMADYRAGLVIIAGPSQSGKTTTAAALLNRINETRKENIITIENPVEFIHSHKNCLITQREIGRHATGFARALRTGLGEDPDILFLSDLPDIESMLLALETAEAGRLVIVIIPAVSTLKTLDFITGRFPEYQQNQIRTALSECLKAVITQRLIPRADGSGQVPAAEILVNTGSVKGLIRHDRLFQIPAVIASSPSHGMISMDQTLIQLIRDEVITREEAYARALDKDQFELYLEELGE
ncbi:MAG TPA: PilT/PilU family type 4a pilus ATPase [bacterium]|nr:PilT/PilU family type 4a pilus ATPase [bacterium]